MVSWCLPGSAYNKCGLFFDFLPRYLFFIFALMYAVFIVVFYRICPKEKSRTICRILIGTHIRPGKAILRVKGPRYNHGEPGLFFYLGALMVLLLMTTICLVLV